MAVQRQQRFRCLDTLERKAHAAGFARVAGADEAGRGSLFGPVYAAAVILSPDRPIHGLADSKVLTPERREELAALIFERALAWAVAAIDADVIDRVNIYQASRLAMKQALEQLAPAPDFALVDGVLLDIATPHDRIIHGDAKSRVIAAASILAKVRRDECMNEWDRTYPQYGFARHKGYCTPEHLEALATHGPTPHHRFTYEPVRLACSGTLWEAAGIPWR